MMKISNPPAVRSSGIPTTAPITLLIAYPKELIRAGLRAMLDETGITIIGEAANAQHTLRLVKEHKPRVVLLNAAMADGDAFELVGKIQKSIPSTKVIFFIGR